MQEKILLPGAKPHQSPTKVLDILTSLPVGLSTIKHRNGRSTMSMSITLELLRESFFIADNDFEKSKKFLSENEYEIAFDGKFGLTSNSFEFTKLFRKRKRA